MKKNILNIVLGCVMGLLIGCVIIGVVIIQNNLKVNNYKEIVISKEKEIKDKDIKIQKLEQTKKQEELKSKIDELNSKISTLKNQKEELETQINSLKENVIKIKGEAKEFPAGYFTAGKDFEIGRYKIYDGNSNFTVHSADGRLRVNIIFGNDPKYSEVSEYLYTFSNGDIIKANSTFKIIPIE